MSKIRSITQEKEDLRTAIEYFDMMIKACLSEHPIFGKAKRIVLQRPQNVVWAWEQIKTVLEEKELIPKKRHDGYSAITYNIDEMHTVDKDIVFIGENK